MVWPSESRTVKNCVPRFVSIIVGSAPFVEDVQAQPVGFGLDMSVPGSEQALQSRNAQFRMGGCRRNWGLRELAARLGLELHAAQNSVGCILGRFCRVLDGHFPAVLRTAVEFRLPSFDQHVGWIGQRNANRR